MPRIGAYSDEPDLPDLYDDQEVDQTEGDEPTSKQSSIIHVGKTIEL